MKNLLMLVLVTLAVGCGGAAMEQEEVQTETLGTQESALLVCGSTCPTGYYVAQRNCDISCGSCSTTWNQVVCNPIPSSGTINPCGSTCPTGFVNQGLTCNSTCWTCFAPNFTNSVSCRK